MKPSKAVGLGEPDVTGKKSLFQPPQKKTEPKPEAIESKDQKIDRRVRMTLEVTLRSLIIIQEAQGKFRLDTGHPLPKWKIISEALELYEKKMKGEGSGP
jgi:hypothetical protein